MNQRIIKFRAFDTKNKVWLTEVSCLEALLDDSDAAVSHHDIDDWENSFFYPANPLGSTYNGRIVYQQFVGLFDKNKKEIYEGDIVRCYRLRGEATLGNENGGFNWYTCIEIGQIRWSDIGCGFVEDYEHIRYDDIWPLSEGTSHRYEVIGNIFENPELIKQK